MVCNIDDFIYPLSHANVPPNSWLHPEKYYNQMSKTRFYQ